MRDNHLANDLTLSVGAAFRDLATGSTAALDSPLLRQVVPAETASASSAPAHQATFIMVEGNPAADIHALERISTVVFAGRLWIDPLC